MVLINRNWEDRGEILLPHVDQVFGFDEQTGEQVIARTIDPPDAMNQKRWRPMYVFPSNGKYHFIRREPVLDTTPGELKFRFSHKVGFDFVTGPDQDEPASAMAPLNARREVTGWKAYPMVIESAWFPFAIVDDELWIQVFNKQSQSDQYQTVLSLNINATSPETVNSNVLASQPRFQSELSVVLSSETNDIYSLVYPGRGEITVHRFTGKQFDKLPIQIDGMISPIVRQLLRCLSLVIAIFWIGTIVIVLAAPVVVTRYGDSAYSFGKKTVSLAPLSRRVFAKLIDYSLVTLPLGIQVVSWISQTNSETLVRKFYALVHARIDSLPPETIDLVPYVPTFGWAVFAWVMLVIMTGLWGITPGKWLCRIRVIRTTLRPCGFVRAILRELLIGLDAPLLLTAIPAIICWLVTDNRQRFGDLIADTIVISCDPRQESRLPISETADANVAT